MNQCLEYVEPEPAHFARSRSPQDVLLGAGALRTFYLESELKPKWFSGAVKNFHGSASLRMTNIFWVILRVDIDRHDHVCPVTSPNLTFDEVQVKTR